MSILRLSISVAGALLLGTHLSIAQGIDARDLSVQQQLVSEVASPAAADLRVSAWVDRPGNTYEVGDSVHLSVKVNADAYLTIVSVGPSGEAVLLYPNEFQPGVLVKGGSTVEIPGKDAVAQIVASNPAGRELIRVIASRSPIDVIDEDLLVGAGAFKTITGGAEKIARDLELIRQAHPDVTFYDKVIKTVATEETAEVSTELPPSATPKAAPLIATDKSSYVIGDTVQLAVTALDACQLWVVNVSSDGTARVLFPNKLVSENALAPSGTVLISGGASPVRVVAAGPEGTEAVYALCGSETTPPWQEGVDFTELFPALHSETPLAKALIAMDPADTDAVIPDTYSWSVKVLTVAAQQ